MSSIVAWALFLALLAIPPAPPQKKEEPHRIDSIGPEIVQVEGLPPERVRLSVSVLDESGRPVRGLQPDDFIVKEDGEVQELVDFDREADREDRPLSVVFLIDRSGSIGKQMSKWRQACVALLSELRPVDEIRVATFTDTVTILQDFTNDATKLSSIIHKLGPTGGGTRVFESIHAEVMDLKNRPGRKVLFVLTDGLDNDRPDVWNALGDPYLAELVRDAVASQVTLVTILPGPTGRAFLAVQDLAIQTGGWWLYPSDDLPGLVRRLGERLLESYFLSYDSIRPPGDLGRRRLEVSLARSDGEQYEIRTIGGVFGERPLFDLLARDLEEGDEQARLIAATYLGDVAEEKASKLLRKALKDEAPRVRAAAAVSLGRRLDFSAIRRLARLLSDTEEIVQRSAATALQQLLVSAPDERTRAQVLDALEAGDS